MNAKDKQEQHSSKVVKLDDFRPEAKKQSTRGKKRKTAKKKVKEPNLEARELIKLRPELTYISGREIKIWVTEILHLLHEHEYLLYDLEPTLDAAVTAGWQLFESWKQVYIGVQNLPASSDDNCTEVLQEIHYRLAENGEGIVSQVFAFLTAQILKAQVPKRITSQDLHRLVAHFKTAVEDTEFHGFSSLKNFPTANPKQLFEILQQIASDLPQTPPPDQNLGDTLQNALFEIGQSQMKRDPYLAILQFMVAVAGNICLHIPMEILVKQVKKGATSSGRLVDHGRLYPLTNPDNVAIAKQVIEAFEEVPPFSEAIRFFWEEQLTAIEKAEDAHLAPVGAMQLLEWQGTLDLRQVQKLIAKLEENEVYGVLSSNYDPFQVGKCKVILHAASPSLVLESFPDSGWAKIVSPGAISGRINTDMSQKSVADPISVPSGTNLTSWREKNLEEQVYPEVALLTRASGIVPQTAERKINVLWSRKSGRQNNLEVLSQALESDIVVFSDPQIKKLLDSALKKNILSGNRQLKGAFELFLVSTNHLKYFTDSNLIFVDLDTPNTALPKDQEAQTERLVLLVWAANEMVAVECAKSVSLGVPIELQMDYQGFLDLQISRLKQSQKGMETFEVSSLEKIEEELAALNQKQIYARLLLKDQEDPDLHTQLVEKLNHLEQVVSLQVINGNQSSNSILALETSS